MRLLSLFKNGSKALVTPHVPVRTSLASALTLLRSSAEEVLPLDGDERGYRASSRSWDLIIYTAADEVDAVWYDDKAGRGFSQSKLAKIHSYLSRYGTLADWEMRMDNGWMRYWYNPKAGVMMVYGIHKDVIRFNKYDGE